MANVTQLPKVHHRTNSNSLYKSTLEVTHNPSISPGIRKLVTKKADTISLPLSSAI